MDTPEDNTESEDSSSEEEEVESDEEFRENLEFAFGRVQIESNDEDEADENVDDRQRIKILKYLVYRV